MKTKFVISGISIFIFCFNYLFSSNWVKTDSLPTGIVEAIAINPVNGNVFAGIYGEGIFRSSENGKNWIKVNNGLPDKLVKSLKFNSQGTAFVGLNGKGVYKSTDNGENWIESYNGLTNKNVLTLYISQSGNIYAGTWFYGSVFVSTDNGDNWADIGPANNDIHAVFAGNNGYIYAGSEYNGLFRTNDNGKKWDSKGFSGNMIYDLISDNSGIIYCASNDGVYTSSNNADKWNLSVKGMGSMVTRALAVADGSAVFAGTFAGIFKSGDKGENWLDYSSGLNPQNKNIYCIAVNNENNLFVGTNDGIYRTIFPDDVTEISLNEIDLTVFPQPFSETVNFIINSNNNDLVSLEIFDIHGNTIDKQNSLNEKNNFVMSFTPKNFSAGIYYYKMIIGNKFNVGKIIYTP